MGILPIRTTILAAKDNVGVYCPRLEVLLPFDPVGVRFFARPQVAGLAGCIKRRHTGI
jgi:hypothetical protein